MQVRMMAASVVAGMMVAGGLSVAAAPAASAADCPTLGPSPYFSVTPFPLGGVVDWSGCNMGFTDVNGAKLDSAKLVGTSFQQAQLAGASLTGATLTNAVLDNAIMASVDLTGATLDGVSVQRTWLNGAQYYCSDTGIVGTGITGTPYGLPSGWALSGGTLTVPRIPCSADGVTPLPSHPGAAFGRASADEVCADGWEESWQDWHNDGTGGWVCHIPHDAQP